ncbi:MAG TPA: SirB2 family protein [Steroidobacter sp.]|uniref:SirB2 family protein n=1 Tax=Steroidobacter sp. TaxID=1978227 RepID=UPI002ED8DD2F
MIEFYPQIKAVHIAAVMASGLLFLVRGAALHTGMSWPMAAPVRYVTYTIDTVLLAAALTLAVTLHQYPFVQSWLTVKVLLLVVYIFLGTFALKRGATRIIRVLYWIAALLVYGFIISVARAHHPAGLFADTEPRGTISTSQVAASRI